MSFDWSNKRILITGGTGSFGRAFIKHALTNLPIKTICVFSRDELKQSELRELYPNEKRLRFFIGDVRDQNRIRLAMQGVDIVIHAAAMKRVEVCEYNPFEAVQTNIVGTQNVVIESILAGCSHVLALSTDKAVNPVNLYGATKLCLEKIVTASGNLAGSRKTKLSCVRYGNVAGSRGSVIPLFREQSIKGKFTITDERMTRFWITLSAAVQFVLFAIDQMKGGEVFVPKLPSFHVVDLAKAMNPEAQVEIIGIRQGEKLHEVMISSDESRQSTDLGAAYAIKDGKVGSTEFVYDSGSNSEFLEVDELREMIRES